MTFAGSAWAQPGRLPRHDLPINVAVGPVENVTASAVVVFDELIDGGRVPWMRLQFRDVVLPAGSYVVLSSDFDGGTQILDARSLQQWRNASAYFNGSTVRVELVAGPNSAGTRLTISGITVGEWQGDDLEFTQCGTTDDRVPSNHPGVARLMPATCTAWIFNEHSCFMSAGHCLDNPASVEFVEFNVPPSLSGGTVQFSAPEDQYPVLLDSVQFRDNGVGDDYGLFRTSPNTTTGLTAYEVQQFAFPLASTAPSEWEGFVTIIGHGSDTGTANHTQQTSVGPFMGFQGSPDAPAVKHAADTTGGSSGSPIILDATGKVIGIHTHGGCNAGITDTNKGTALVHPVLESWYTFTCVPPVVPAEHLPLQRVDAVPCPDCD